MQYSQTRIKAIRTKSFDLLRTTDGKAAAGRYSVANGSTPDVVAHCKINVRVSCWYNIITYTIIAHSSQVDN
jgi:hypothetical protein